tara:strand:+ start:276 stop:509 length:234 start_codon:yes stop_codon:yes gene_type:complete
MATFEGRIQMTGGAALLFEGHYWHGSVWFPLSQVRIEDDNLDTGTVVIHIADWLCKKRGLLEFTQYQSDELEAMNGI